MKKAIILILSLIILLSAIVYGLITFTGVSVPSGSTTNTSAIVEYNFSSDSNGITSVKWNWNGTNYSV
ncbi:MAG: hypothetical protein KKD44_27755, partial [Proteobacteria bacterium]|nr:hypothetical protein [Pseudomonadota bacterium]